ncbi:redox-sensitive transcriptional activator SoxR [Vibrio sp. ZSDZ34]|uniref:Redox-sensitive transcriptional activator SoxR n=1 Tax=Vibrio gelatinilyticus TaxID=2893468 RepID=A0A9X1WD18_9VIBR|nr:redox-sensitive transcriptional activator SoxR [Vibrio gelatinilyticus]MCJ2376913.1 redox-sensitive transcriptional activator SoxR [Vibrio gelatinilyticus]
MLSIGQVAKRADVAVSAIHFWERKQLISSTRNAGNQRQYSSDILRRIAVIKIAQQVGLTLEEIKEAMSVLPLNKAPTKQQWAKMSRQWHGTLQARIDNLQKLSGQLDHCIGCGCLSMKSCELYNPEDKLSEKGSGPQLW